MSEQWNDIILEFSLKYLSIKRLMGKRALSIIALIHSEIPQITVMYLVPLKFMPLQIIIIIITNTLVLKIATDAYKL